MENNQGQKKLLENPVVGSLVVPIAIVLVGALIIFGVTKMISTEQSYKDLVSEMQSKKFGNRWIAAYELSKLISTDNIPEEDKEWLIGELKSLYTSSEDPRTREFIVVAAGALKKQSTIPLLLLGLDEPDPKIKFHVLVALGNMPKDLIINWEKVLTQLDGQDQGLQVAAMLSLSTHEVHGAGPRIKKFLASSDRTLKYTAATALIHFKESAALPVLNEIVSLKHDATMHKFNVNQVQQLKLNIINAYQRKNWRELLPLVTKMANDKSDKEVVTKAQNVLNMLKN